MWFAAPCPPFSRALCTLGLAPDKGTEEPMQRENGCTPGPSTL